MPAPPCGREWNQRQSSAPRHRAETEETRCVRFESRPRPDQVKLRLVVSLYQLHAFTCVPAPISEGPRRQRTRQFAVFALFLCGHHVQAVLGFAPGDFWHQGCRKRLNVHSDHGVPYEMLVASCNFIVVTSGKRGEHEIRPASPLPEFSRHQAPVRRNAFLFKKKTFRLIWAIYGTANS